MKPVIKGGLVLCHDDCDEWHEDSGLCSARYQGDYAHGRQDYHAPCAAFYLHAFRLQSEALARVRANVVEAANEWVFDAENNGCGPHYSQLAVKLHHALKGEA